MSDYTWPTAWLPARFEMRVAPNNRVFVGPYTPTTQVVDLLGERWMVSLDLPPGVSKVQAAAFEAFFDRLHGRANRIMMWNLTMPTPSGTVSDTDAGTAQWKTASNANATWQTASSGAATWSFSGPVFYAASQGASAVTVACSPGDTLNAGDMVGNGSQVSRVVAGGVADSTGRLAVEIYPRLRADMANGTAVVTTRPTAKFILKADGVPVTRRPGMFDGLSLELIEAL